VGVRGWLCWIGHVLTALAEGLDTSAASRVFGHRPATIAAGLTRAGAHGALLHTHWFHELHLPHIQMDEVRTRSPKRPRRAGDALRSALTAPRSIGPVAGQITRPKPSSVRATAAAVSTPSSSASATPPDHVMCGRAVTAATPLAGGGRRGRQRPPGGAALRDRRGEAAVGAGPGRLLRSVHGERGAGDGAAPEHATQRAVGGDGGTRAPRAANRGPGVPAGSARRAPNAGDRAPVLQRRSLSSLPFHHERSLPLRALPDGTGEA